MTMHYVLEELRKLHKRAEKEIKAIAKSGNDLVPVSSFEVQVLTSTAYAIGHLEGSEQMKRFMEQLEYKYGRDNHSDCE